MKCDELNAYKADVYIPVYGSIADADVYLKEKADEAIAELKDKIQMHDFFWEGCGFAKRGFKNTIAVSEAFDRLEDENAELKKKLMPCLNGDCILTCEVVEKYGKENAELKQKLEDVNELIKTARQMLEDAKASHYAESVDAGMRERRLRRALFIALAYEAKYKKYWYCELLAKEGSKIVSDGKKARKYNVEIQRSIKCEAKCRAKAEQYK